MNSKHGLVVGTSEASGCTRLVFSNDRGAEIERYKGWDTVGENENGNGSKMLNISPNALSCLAG